MLRADKKTIGTDESRSLGLVFSKYSEASTISIFGLKCSILHLHGEKLSSVSLFYHKTKIAMNGMTSENYFILNI
jgi:hypothetical protein